MSKESEFEKAFRELIQGGIDRDYDPDRDGDLDFEPDDDGYADQIMILERQYSETGNPWYAWEAYSICSYCEFSFPEWLRKYFDECHQNLSHYVRGLLTPHNKRVYRTNKLYEPLAERLEKFNVHEAVSESFGFKKPGKKGRGNFLTDADDEYVTTGAWVARALDRGDKEYIAIEKIAKFFKMSKTKVRQDFHKYQEYCKMVASINFSRKSGD